MGRWDDDDYRDYGWRNYPKPKAIETTGGIRAQSKGTAFGESWWAKKWIAVLNGFDIGARLGRGRSYARKGQVLSIDVAPGVVTAKVQGSRPKPYDVTVKTRTLSHPDRAALGKALSRQAIFAAKLLAGEMPQDIEDAFREAKLSLFPGRLDDLTTSCSCPDWSNPCKHVAAVYYLLGEEFDRDPFLIFTLRGLSRSDLVALLGDDARATGFVRRTAPALPPEPLPCAADAFWTGRAFDDVGSLEIPSVPAALPTRLGKFPFWRGAAPLAEAVKASYTSAAGRATEVVLGRGSESVSEASG